MKKISILLFGVFFSSILMAQVLRLSDSVIFIQDKPVAFYSKFLNNSPLRYDMEVYNREDYLLIKAEAIKFASPLRYPVSFYYYEISFPPLADTFSIYIEEEAFPLVLANIINDYHLINSNQLNAAGVKQFKSNYYGGAALAVKIKSFTNELNGILHLDEQVVRDRSKPVSIINNRTIIQDGKTIGYYNQYNSYDVSSERQESSRIDSVSNGIVYRTPVYQTVDKYQPVNLSEITLKTGTKINTDQLRGMVNDETEINGMKLWELSDRAYRKNKKASLPVAASRFICYLVAANAL